VSTSAGKLWSQTRSVAYLDCRWPKLDPASPRPKDGSTARTAGLSRNAGVAERFSTVSADRRILGVT
jgi:hypothetical protein